MDLQAAKAYILRKLREELPERRAYHSLEHTLDVYASVIDIAAQEGVTGDDLLLLKTAALYHDAGFTEQEVEHERVSCDIARRVLPGCGYAPPQIERICTLIMDTRVPQRPTDALSMILCDADLDYLGRSDYPRISRLLFEEMRAHGKLTSELEWNRLQVRFLEDHRYFTATNKRSREPGKAGHLAALRRLVEDQGAP